MAMRSNEKFFNDMYQKTICPLKSYTMKHSCHPDFVDDILQEVYLEAFRHIQILRTHENHIGWLYKTAEYKILKFNKRYYENAAHETGYSETETAGLFFTSEEPAAARFEEFQSILSPEEYDLFLKKYRDGLPYQALAKITHTSVSGSRARLSRIKKKLRKHLPEFSTEVGSGSQHKPLG